MASSRVTQIKGHLNSTPESVKDDHSTRTREYLESRIGRPKLEDKVCVITGGGTPAGIGRAAGFAFAANGAHTIYLTDLSTQHLDANANAIMTKYPGTKVVPLKVDASSEADIKGVCQRAIKENGRLDVFFAAAGIDLSNEKDSFSVGTPEIFMKIQTVNALSAFLAIKHASDAMKVTGPGKPNSAGSIVTVASDTGLRNTDLNPTAAYHASKAAVISLCQTGAWYNRNTGIRVNTICPGIIDTQMTEKMFNMVRNRGTVGKVGQLAPMGRFGIPEEIANAAVFLASDDASYITGVALPVDGGIQSSVPVLIRAK